LARFLLRCVSAVLLCVDQLRPSGSWKHQINHFPFLFLLLPNLRAFIPHFVTSTRMVFSGYGVLGGCTISKLSRLSPCMTCSLSDPRRFSFHCGLLWGLLVSKMYK
jgi:hypothetical protein